MIIKKNWPTLSWKGNRYFQICMIFLIAVAMLAATVSADPLSSWNEGQTKQTIIKFVRAVTDKSSPNYVLPEQRIATFDNDGTLWAEQPMYFQAFFAFDRVKAIAPQHPEWKDRQPFKAILENDRKALLASGEKGAMEVVMSFSSSDRDFQMLERATTGLLAADAPGAPHGCEPRVRL